MSENRPVPNLNNLKTPPGALLLAASLPATLMIALEVLRAVRHSQWSGFTQEALAGIAVAWVIYAVTLFILNLSLLRILRRFPLRSLASPIAAMSLWCVLASQQHWDDARGLLVALALLVVGTGLPFASLRWSLVLLSGAAAMSLGVLAAGHYWLLHVDRSSLVLQWPLIFAFVILLATASTVRTGRVIRMAFLSLAPALPPLFVLATTLHSQTTDQRPDVVLIVADTLRAKDLKLYGGPVDTPNLEALAKRGVLFERAYSLAPWTLPSMTGMFASRYPPGLTPGLSQAEWEKQLWQYCVPQEAEPLQVHFKQAYYDTAAFTANPVLWGIPGMTEGFNVNARAHPLLLSRGGLFQATPLLQAVVARLLPGWAPVIPNDTTSALTRYFHAYNSRRDDRASFAWIHYMDPHTPYAAPGAPKSPKGGWPYFFPYRGGEQWGQPVLGEPGFTIAQENRAWVEQLYRLEIKRLDAFVGEVLHAVEATGRLDNTIICFTSDHGEEFWEHGDWGHGQSLYDEQLRVPWIMAGPGIKPGTIAQPVSAISVAPTLYELSGIQPAMDFEGTSLATLLLGTGAPEAGTIFAQGTSNRAIREPLAMALEWPHKLVKGMDSGSTQLFNLEVDPHELHDLSEAQPGIAARLLDALSAWQSSFDSELNRGDAIEGDTLEQLESMGYL